MGSIIDVSCSCLSSPEPEKDQKKEEPNPFGTRPGVGVGIKILNRETNKVLIGKRIKEGLFGYPGGHLERFQSYAECAQMEIEEETGLKIPLSSFVFL